MSSLQRTIKMSRPPPSPMMPMAGGRGSNRMGSAKQHKQPKSYVPKMWDEFFAEKRDVRLDDDHVFRVYLSAAPEQTAEAATNAEPLLVLLHGGGYSALTWSHFSTEITQIIECQCLALDLRGHGDSAVADEGDLAAQTLANDVAQVLNSLQLGRPIMLIGHSMGGAICVHIAAAELVPALIGCVVIDVVEGTAMESLASMQSFLRSRPKEFRSIPQAIEWCVRGGQIRNVDSAAVSMPGQIINKSTGKLATNELPLAEVETAAAASASATAQPFANPNSIAEDVDADETTASPPAAAILTPAAAVASAPASAYTWRIDLARTEPFWAGWFEDLSQKFLDLRVPKLLLLANIDGLDRTLTVGQMQGRFQLQVLARSGHVVHEDQPHEVAEIVAGYMVRNKFAKGRGDFAPALLC